MLVPCSVCQRHVRHSESACPFCGAEREPTAGPSRERGLARGTKRATLVALGLTLAGPACGGRGEDDDRDDSSIIAPYGLSPHPTGSEGGRGGTGGSAGSGSGGAAGSTGGDEGDVTVPPYGAMPPIPDGGSGGDGSGADAPDSGTTPDAGGGDAGSETPDAGD